LNDSTPVPLFWTVFLLSFILESIQLSFHPLGFINNLFDCITGWLHTQTEHAIMPSYVQRNMFDALDVEDIEYEEEEVVQDEYVFF